MALGRLQECARDQSKQSETREAVNIVASELQLSWSSRQITGCMLSRKWLSSSGYHAGCGTPMQVTLADGPPELCIISHQPNTINMKQAFHAFKPLRRMRHESKIPRKSDNRIVSLVRYTGITTLANFRNLLTLFRAQ